jgi:ribose 5-phosphate isomerase B
MKVAIGSDHAGFALKENIRRLLIVLGILVEDTGTNSNESVDYPEYAERVARMVREGTADRGILVCNTGIGMCIAANKIQGIRAAQAWTPDIARLSRQHNDANVLCLSGNFVDPALAQEIVKVFLETPFDGGRHQRRINEIMELEQR